MATQFNDVIVDNLQIALRESAGDIPLVPVVGAIDVVLSDRALVLGVKAALEMAKGKVPVEVEFDHAQFTESGADVTVSAGINRFLKAKATAVLDITATNANAVRVDIREIRTLGKISVEGMIGPVLDKALDKAAEKPGIDRNPAANRSLLIEPNALLAELGIPLEFADGGGWTVTNATGQLTVRYTTV
ncbi:MAG: hypothetical protein IT335_07520 [Thermomicrobiales bacterium]|nr:hypothetical protein [Thermomicrobiales bacterium]